jgi:hypothetical protein
LNFFNYPSPFISSKSERGLNFGLLPVTLGGPAVGDRNDIQKVGFNLIGRDIPQHFARFKLAADSSQWDWTVIYGLIIIVLAHDDRQAQSAPALAFYAQLLDYFSSRFAQETSQVVQIAQILSQLLEFLTSKSWGRERLESHQEFGRGIVQVFRTFGSREPSPVSAIWFFVKEFLHFASTEVGATLIGKWHLLDDITNAGKSYRVLRAAEMVARELTFSDHWRIVNRIFLTFLRSESSEIATMAFNELRSKSRESQNIKLHGINEILMEYVQTEPHPPFFSRALGLFCELLITNSDFLPLVASNRFIHQFIHNNARSVYCILLRDEEWLQYGDLKAELKYWMKEGYLNTYRPTMKRLKGHSLHRIQILHYQTLLNVTTNLLFLFMLSQSSSKLRSALKLSSPKFPIFSHCHNLQTSLIDAQLCLLLVILLLVLKLLRLLILSRLSNKCFCLVHPLNLISFEEVYLMLFH